MSTTRALALSIALACTACGGGGGGGSDPAPMLTPVQAELAPEPAGEGYVGTSPLVQLGTPLLSAGDNALGATFVAVLCFDLTGIGPVTDAQLEINQGVPSGDPWSMGPLYIDHIDGGGVLDMGDLAGGTLTSEALTLMDQPSWTLDVTALVATDVAAGRSTTTLRLRFDQATNGDAVNDFMRIVGSAHVNAALRPVLTVTHLVP